MLASTTWFSIVTILPTGSTRTWQMGFVAQVGCGVTHDPTLMPSSIKKNTHNITCVVAVTTTRAARAIFFCQNQSHHPSSFSPPLPTDRTTSPRIRTILHTRAHCRITTFAADRHGRHTTNIFRCNQSTTVDLLTGHHKVKRKGSACWDDK